MTQRKHRTQTAIPATLLLALLLPTYSSAAVPRRIVSLAPSSTEILGGLNLQHLLVGITLHTDYPPEVLHLPRVGSYAQLNLEAIVGLEPDLIVGTVDGNPPETIARLDNIGIPVILLDLRNYDAIQDSIRLLGITFDKTPEAEVLIQEMQRTAKCIQDRTRHLPKPRVLFFYQLQPLYSPGHGSFTNELIAMAGGSSLTAESRVPYPRLSMEEVIHMDPDVVVVSTMSAAQDREFVLQWWKRWPAISAVRNDHVYAIDGRNLDRPSHRVILGLETLARALHPEAFQNYSCLPSWAKSR